MEGKVVTHIFNDYSHGTWGTNHEVATYIPHGVEEKYVLDLFQRQGARDVQIKPLDEVRPCSGCERIS